MGMAKNGISRNILPSDVIIQCRRHTVKEKLCSPLDINALMC